MNETELLFTQILGCSRSGLYLEKGKKIPREYSLLIAGALKRRISGEPLEYILGTTEFMGLPFKVGPAVLIPRPDTEILVETALRYAAGQVESHKPEARGSRILDIGTGSGCIAVSLAKSLPEARITATDISPEALEIARQNARLNAVQDKIDFLNCDLFPPCELQPASYDLIISNPPYIKSDVIATLQAEVRHEPRIALDGGASGLEIYRRILRLSPDHLKPQGSLILEIGFDQKEDLVNIIDSLQIFEVKEVIKDYNNINRVLVLRLKGKNG
jgi:release factor glutamine methyltransferase